jgi:hypothetical protein
MFLKAALTTTAAFALCVPALAPAASVGVSDQGVANVAYVAPASFADLAFPTKKGRNKGCKGGGLINVSCNTAQVPVQACNNNLLSNINLGLGSKNQSSSSKNKGNCSQKNSSKH